MRRPASRLTGRRIGFVSTRLAGTDGVSLETEKWATVLERGGHTCVYFCGACNQPSARTRVVPEAHFEHDAIAAIYSTVFASEWGDALLLEHANPHLRGLYGKAFMHTLRPPRVTARIQELKDHLKAELYAFVREYQVELLILENAVTIPLNIPLGLALTEFIAETGYPAIAHHHDFYWERQRFLLNVVQDYLSMAFPPHLPSVRHVVISSLAAHQLSLRTGISAMIIPNVMDFDRPPAPPDDYARDVRAALRLAPDELLFLQPTRVVPRKGIEHAIELTKRVERKARLVISHASGDEGHDYERRVRDYAELLGVAVNFESEIIREQRGQTPDGRKVYTLWDLYPQADLVTYPSSVEGFGNAFLEAIYFRRPIVVNNYSIFDVDIKPKGFHVIEFEGYITDSTVRQAQQILDHPQQAAEMAEANYRQARRYFSYTVLERRLQSLITDCFGEENDF